MISNQQKALTVFRLGGWRYIRSATATSAIDFTVDLKDPGSIPARRCFFAVQLNKNWFMGGIGGTIVEQSAVGFYRFRAGRPTLRTL